MHSHSVIAGRAPNILEYTLETRMLLLHGCSATAADVLLEDVLLTLPLWMPSNEACNVLKRYYTMVFLKLKI